MKNNLGRFVIGGIYGDRMVCVARIACCVLGLYYLEVKSVSDGSTMKINCGMITVAVRYQINTLYVFTGSEIPNRKTG